MELNAKIPEVKARINFCIQALRSVESTANNPKASEEQCTAAIEKLGEALRSLGKLGAKPLTPFEQECLDEAAEFLQHKLNNDEKENQ